MVIQSDPNIQPFTLSPLPTHFSLPYHGFTRLFLSKNKTKTINFDEDLCGLHKLQSDTEFWEGLLKYAEGFLFGGETRFSCFSLFLFEEIATKSKTVFQGKRKRTWKNKNGTANESRLQRQTHSLGWVFKNEMRFLHHKSPYQNEREQKRHLFSKRKQSNSISKFATAKMRNFGHFIFVLGDPGSFKIQNTKSK